MKINTLLFIVILVVLYPLSMKPSFAASANLAQKIANCTKIENNNARLNCYDNLSKVVTITKNSVVIKKDTAVKVLAKKDIAVKVLAKDDEANFAIEHLKKDPAESIHEVNSITLTVSKLKKLIRGQWVITFDNGQKWRQKDAGTFRLVVGDTVELTKGTFGSVHMKKVGTKKSIRVKRLL